jgi:predicted Zn-dependent protease with MMP-like domain
MDQDAFSTLVAEALDSLPEEFLVRMENVEVLIEDWPSSDDLERAGLDPRRDRASLLGLYHGVPLTHRGAFYSALPDTITIFQKPIERLCGDDDDAIRDQVRHTVIHEIAHYYGISDERLDELGYA